MVLRYASRMSSAGLERIFDQSEPGPRRPTGTTIWRFRARPFRQSESALPHEPTRPCHGAQDLCGFARKYGAINRIRSGHLHDRPSVSRLTNSLLGRGPHKGDRYDDRMASRDFPSREQAEAGARLAVKNARTLLETSGRVAKTGAYGPAVSLAVLAGEESIKSLGLMAFAEQWPIPTRKQLSLILRHHEPRLLTAGMLAGAGEVLLAGIAAFIAAFAKQGEDASSKPHSAEEQWSRAAWWSEADTFKNRGLYVEFVAGKWHAPSDVSEAEFTKAEQMARGFVDWVEDMLKENDPKARRGIVAAGPARLGQAVVSPTTSSRTSQ